MKRGRRITIWIAAILATLLMITGIVAFAFFHTFYPGAPAADFPPAPDTTTAQRQDLAYFENYLTLNRSYTPAALEQAKNLLVEYRAKAGTFSSAQFDLAIARMAALADNGHSHVYPGPLSRQHNHLPCHLYHFADGYYVLRARGACKQLLGAKVVALDGHAIDGIADRMFVYFGGPKNHYDQFAAVFFLESPELLHAAGIANAADQTSLQVMLRDGSAQTVIVSAEPADADAPHAYSDEYLSPARIEKEPSDWAALLPADAPMPMFLRDYANPFHTEYWPDKNVSYVQFRSNADEPGHPIGAFIAQVENDIKAHRPRHIVLDLRLDQGGNFTTTAALMKNLVTLADSVEHVYVLTSAWTFSAGDVSLALLKQHGGNKITVIGQEVGDRIRMWAEGGSMTLPNAKLSLGFATGLHDYSRSCSGQPGCFWIMAFYPMQVASLAPDITVPYAFADYILELTRGSSPAPR